MILFSQEFKVQSEDKVLTRHSDQTIKNIADNLGVGYSTFQKWIRLAKNNKLEKPETIMSKEKSLQDWSKTHRLEAIMHYHSLNDEQVSAFCRETVIYPYHIKEWKIEFLSDSEKPESVSKREQTRLKQ